MSNSRRNRTRGDRTGSADAPLDDFNSVLSRIEKYVIGISHEMQTLNDRLEDYGQQINHNSQSIFNIEKKLKRKNVRKYRHSPAICHGIRRYAGRTTHKRVKKSNAFEMKDVQKTALKKRLSIECKEKEKEDVLITEQHENILKDQETSLSINIDGLAASHVDTTEELATSSQDEGTFHVQDTESSDIRNEKPTSSVEPAGEQATGVLGNDTSNADDTGTLNDRVKVTTTDALFPEKQVTDIRGDETSRTEDTSPSNDMEEVATSDISPLDVLPLALGKNSVLGCDNCVPSEESAHFANNRMVWKLFAFGDYNIEDSCKSKAKSGNNTKTGEVHTKCRIVTSVAEFLPLHQIIKFEDNNGSSSIIKQREDVVQNIRDETPDQVHQQPKPDIEDKSASRTRQAGNSTPKHHVDSSDHGSTTSLPCSDFRQKSKSNRKDESAPSIKPRASLTPKRLYKFSDFHRQTKEDERREFLSHKTQKEYLTFKLERDIPDTHFYERTILNQKDESTTRIKIKREHISPSIRGDFSNSHLRSKQDEEEVYAPRQRQTGDLSHLVDREDKKLLEKLQSEYDDFERKKNLRRGTFG